MTREEMQEKLTFEKKALKSLREAYLAIADGGVQQYSIGSRSLSKLDLPKISAEIKAKEKAIADLAAAMSGRKRARAFGVVPRNW